MVTLALLQGCGAGSTQRKVQFSVDGCWDDWTEQSSRRDEYAFDKPIIVADVAKIFRNNFGMSNRVLSVFVD